MKNPQAHAPGEERSNSVKKFPICRLNTCPEAKGMITKKGTGSFK